MQTIALVNQKGGVGKSTTAVNLGIGLARQGKKVLLVDADSQGNLTEMLGWQQPDKLEHTLAYLLEKVICDEPFNMEEGILHHEEGVDLIPSNIELSGMEVVLVNTMSRETVLRTYLNEIKRQYDYILIDCPPQLSILTINALSCADGVVIPVKTDYLAYRGLTQLQDSIQEIQELINPELKVLGVIATLYDTRVGDDHDILGLLCKEYNLLGVIKRLAVAKKGIYDGLAAVEQAPSSELAQEYVAIANMIMSGREKREEQEHE